MMKCNKKNKSSGKTFIASSIAKKLSSVKFLVGWLNRKARRWMKKILRVLTYFVIDIVDIIYPRFIASEEELMIERNKTLIKIILSLRIICHILFVTLVSIIVALITCNN